MILINKFCFYNSREKGRERDSDVDQSSVVKIAVTDQQCLAWEWRLQPVALFASLDLDQNCVDSTMQERLMTH